MSQRDMTIRYLWYLACVGITLGLGSGFLGGHSSQYQWLASVWQTAYQLGMVAIPPPESLTIPAVLDQVDIGRTLQPSPSGKLMELQPGMLPSSPLALHDPNDVLSLLNKLPYFLPLVRVTTTPQYTNTNRYTHNHYDGGVSAEFGPTFALTLRSDTLEHSFHHHGSSHIQLQSVHPSFQIGPHQHVMIPIPVLRTLLLGFKAETDATFMMPAAEEAGTTTTKKIPEIPIVGIRLLPPHLVAAAGHRSNVPSPTQWQRDCQDGLEPCFSCSPGSLPVPLLTITHPIYLRSIWFYFCERERQQHATVLPSILSTLIKTSCTNKEMVDFPTCQQHVGVCKIHKALVANTQDCYSCGGIGPFCSPASTSPSTSSEQHYGRIIQRSSSCGNAATLSVLYANGTHCGCVCCAQDEQHCGPIQWQ